MSSLSRIWFVFCLLFSCRFVAHADDVRQVNVAVNKMIFNAADGQLYCGGVSGSYANSIMPLDPETATLGTPVSLGAAPQDMVISSDGRYIDSALGDRTRIRRFDTVSQMAGIEWGVGGELYAEDMVAVPGSPGTVIVSRAESGLSPRHEDIVAYDNGVLRDTPNRAAGANFIEVNESGTRLYGYFSEISSFDFVRWDIDANGFSNGSVIHPISGFYVNFKYAGGRAYGSNGVIFDPESGQQLGNFSSQSLDLTVPDPKMGRLITATQKGTNLTIRSQNIATLDLLGAIVVPGVNGSAGQLVRWGDDGLAFRTDSQVFLVRSPLTSNASPPALSGVSPSQARIGDSVVITGTELTATNSVRFNGIEAAFHVDSDSQITAVVPMGATSGLLTVTTAGGAKSLSFSVLLPTIRVDDASVSEGNGDGTNTLDFVVTLSYASRTPVLFDFGARSNTASVGSDFERVSGSRSFAPGQTSQVISVPVSGDTSYEADETLILQLFSVVGAATQAPDPAPVVRNNSNGHFYQLLEGTMTWGDGKYAAESHSYLGVVGHLATATSAEEDAFIGKNFPNTTLWLGGEQPEGSAEPTSGFRWITGEDFTYTNWHEGEPNNANSGEDAIQRIYDRWNDVSRNEHYLVLIEYDTAPGATGPDLLAVGTILNDDARPRVSVGDVKVVEGNNGSTDAKFSVSLSSASWLPVTVRFTTGNVSAAAGKDYSATSGTLTFAPGEKTKVVSVPVSGDIIDENDETFVLRLDSPTGAFIGDGSGVCTIVDDDTSTLSVDSPFVNEGNSGVSSLNFTIKLSTPSSRAVKLNYRTATSPSPTKGDTATPEIDYIGVPSASLTFEPGQVSKVVSVSIKGDTQREPNEQLTLFVSGTENIEGSTKSLGTIVNDDGVPAISIDNVSVIEGVGGATSQTIFTVSLSAPNFQQVKVEYGTATDGVYGTAAAGSDYTSTKGTLTFAPGETRKTLAVTVRNDALDENDETFSVLLFQPVNASVSKGKGTATIVDDDAIPSLSFSSTPVTLAEGNSGTRQMNFNVLLSAPSGRPVQVTYQTAKPPSNAATAGVDYDTVASQAVTIAPGATSVRLPVTITGDTLYETDERIRVVLSGATNAALASKDSVVEGTILNDDAQPSISINSVSALEGNSGTKTLLFTVRLSAVSGLPTSVRYATSNGTALAGSDYTSISGTLNFALGEMSKTISVTIKGDTSVEANEQFKLVLSRPDGASLANGADTGVGTIENDDRIRANSPSTSNSPSAGLG